MTDVFTVGHSNRPLADFVALVTAYDVRTVVDIRRFPRSRTNPQFDEDTLRAALAAEGIAYRHEPALGGRRSRRDAPGVELQTGWRVDAFRAYAAYATTPAFRHAFDALVATARASPTAIMCSEVLWWRCHRRIVTDYLLAAGFRVRHILGPGHVEEAAMTPFARVERDGTVLYAAP